MITAWINARAMATVADAARKLKDSTAPIAGQAQVRDTLRPTHIAFRDPVQLVNTFSEIGHAI
jgi:hypothetical protein